MSLDPLHGFVFSDPGAEQQRITQMAMQLHREVRENGEVSVQLYQSLHPPVLTYASSVLFNCRLPAKVIVEPEEIKVLHTCTGLEDEEWFYAISASIESLSGPLLQSLDAKLIRRMGDLLLRMPEKCNPLVFHQQVRPMLSGWERPHGLKVTGMKDPVFWHGASAAQSPLFQALDHLLAIDHPPSAQEYRMDMRRHYMLPEHAAYLDWLEANVTPTPDEVAREALARFRRIHLAIVDTYILRQDPRAAGTGGTDPRAFLTSML